MVESEDHIAVVGERCQRSIDAHGNELPGEVVGFRDACAVNAAGAPDGIRYGDRIVTWGFEATLRVGDGLLGRVIDGSDATMDSGPCTAPGREQPGLDAAAPLALERAPIRNALGAAFVRWMLS